jgi:hypothetical protein
MHPVYVGTIGLGSLVKSFRSHFNALLLAFHVLDDDGTKRV